MVYEYGIILVGLALAILLLIFAADDLLNSETNGWRMLMAIVRIIMAAALITMALRNTMLYVTLDVMAKI